MAKSRRDKTVSLTKVKKRNDKEAKKNLVKEIRNCVNSYANLIVLSMDNMRCTNFVKVRQKFKLHSRFFFGKNNVLGVALGRDPESAYEKDLNKVSSLLRGTCALMFTNDKIEDVIEYFSTYQEDEYAIGGEVSKKTIELAEDSLTRFPFAMEPQFRKLGLPTKLDRGVIQLSSNFVVAREGDKLSVEQAKILKLLGEKTTFFKVNVLGYWNKDRGFRKLK